MFIRSETTRRFSYLDFFVKALLYLNAFLA